MSNLNVFEQPKQFYLIFSIEFWERFGFYGMQVILTVYMTRILSMTESHSFVLFAAFSALTYCMVSIGGWIGDKIIGTKRTIILGTTIMTLGYFLLGLSASAGMNGASSLYIAMGFITVGNGLFKANPSSLLSKIYDKEDPRLDGAFTLYYMAINLGSFFAMVLTPWAAQKLGYGFAFSISAVGLLITLLNFLLCLRMLKNIGSEPDGKPLNIMHYSIVVAGSVLFSGMSAYLLQHLDAAHLVLAIGGALAVFIYFRETFRANSDERAQMIVAFVLMLQAVVFFVLYFQMPTSLNFFAIHNISHDIFGFAIAPEQFQALNPFWIMLLSPVLAILYANTGKHFSMPFKFSVGMVLCSLSFFILVLGAKYANENYIVGSNWLIVSYLFQAAGELLVSGLGLAMVAQLVPQRMMGFAMGMWFLTSAASAAIAGWVASLSAIPKDIIDPHKTLDIYSTVFNEIGYTTAAIALVMLFIAPKLTRIIQNANEANQSVS